MIFYIKKPPLYRIVYIYILYGMEVRLKLGNVSDLLATVSQQCPWHM